MRNPQENEMRFVLSILKSPEKEYNANNLAKHMGISAMGALKIARKLEKERILSSRKVGRANVYKINLDNDYAMQYIKFMLKRESQQAKPYVKRWIRELEKIKSAPLIILFGSVLRKGKEAKDIDVLVLVDKKNFESVKKEIEDINVLNEKKIHPVYQTEENLRKHIRKENKVVLNAIKGIFVTGEDEIIEVLQK